MNLDEVKTNLRNIAVWKPTAESKGTPVVLDRVIENLSGYSGPPQVIVHFPRFISDFPVDPDALTLYEPVTSEAEALMGSRS